MSRSAVLTTLINAVPDGRYAGCLNENDYSFFRIKLWTKGPKKGKRTIQVQAAEHWLDGGYIHPLTGLSVGYRLQQTMGQFQAAMCNHQEARYLYAEKLGKCARCGIKLTLQRSRELHIGAECEKHWPEYLVWVLSREPQLAHWLESSPRPSSSLRFPVNGTLTRPPSRLPSKLSM